MPSWRFNAASRARTPDRSVGTSVACPRWRPASISASSTGLRGGLYMAVKGCRAA